MALKYNGAQREEYLSMIGRVGNRWLDVFEGQPEFYSAIFWDLFTGMWLNKGPVKKTDVLGFMKAVKSPHTAAKYVEVVPAEDWQGRLQQGYAEALHKLSIAFL